jgi:hypothetical protein
MSIPDIAKNTVSAWARICAMPFGVDVGAKCTMQ